MSVVQRLKNSPVGVQAQIYLGLLLVAALVAFLIWATISGFWTKQRLKTVTQQRDNAKVEAQVQTTNAKNADGAAANASQTHQAVQSGTVEVRVITEDSAKRIETDAQRPRTYTDPDDLDPLGADSVQELRSAEARVRAAQDRLRGKRTK